MLFYRLLYFQTKTAVLTVTTSRILKTSEFLMSKQFATRWAGQSPT